MDLNIKGYMNRIFKLFLTLITFFMMQTSLKAEQALIGVVNGMVCIECQKKVEAALTEKAGSKATIDVSWPENIAVVSFDGNANLTEEEFKNAVEGVGFTTGKIVKVNEQVNTAADGIITLKKF